jgi:hypothetical protein
VFTLVRGVFSQLLAISRTCLPPAVNRKADEVRSEIRLQISLKAYREELTLREAALKLGFLTAKQFDEWVRPGDMTHPLEPEKTNA